MGAGNQIHKNFYIAYEYTADRFKAVFTNTANTDFTVLSNASPTET